MSLAVLLPGRDTTALVAGLEAALPEPAIQVWPDLTAPEEVRFAVAWKPPRGIWTTMPQLAAVMSYGAGVDFLVDDPTLPASVTVGRLVDPGLARQISAYVLGAVLYRLRGFEHYAAAQREARWAPEARPAQATIGVLGLGAIGGHVARSFLNLGFPVHGWRNRSRAVEGVVLRTGHAGLLKTAAASDFLIATLPATAATRGIIDREVFAAMPAAGLFINVGRGETVVERDLLEALDRGVPAGALLDVFVEEPLPEAHPFWHHRAIGVTPHVAGLTDPAAAVDAVVEAYRAVREDRPMPHRVDRERGY